MVIPSIKSKNYMSATTKINMVNYMMTWIKLSFGLPIIAAFQWSPVPVVPFGALNIALFDTWSGTADGWLSGMRNKYLIWNCNKTISSVTWGTMEMLVIGWHQKETRNFEYQLPWQLLNQNNANNKSAKQRHKMDGLLYCGVGVLGQDKMRKKQHQLVSRRELVD